MRTDPVLEDVLRRLPGWSEGVEPRVEPLEGGITNRNFLVEVGGERYVVRIAGTDTELLGIDRRAEEAAARAAAEVGVGPEVVLFLPELGCLVTRFVEGDQIPPQDLEREEVLAAVVGSIRAIHEGPGIPGAFWAPAVCRAYREVAASRGVPIPEAYDRLIAVAEEIEAAFAASPAPRCPCHNDLLNANLLRDGDHVWIVDYEYAGMGDRFFDLGNFSINNGLSEEAQAALLRRYFGDVRPRHRARLALMRILSDFREAMWGVVQQGISTLDFDYVDYASRHFDRCLRSAADPRYRSWLADAAEAA
ncbi:MAG TPA: phosphotransferase [Actinomycetota bacterium]|nr:phosphotransferase [Actinomycetota bacterium]